MSSQRFDGVGAIYDLLLNPFGRISLSLLNIKKNSTVALDITNESNNQAFGVDTINNVLTGLAADKKADKTYVEEKIAELQKIKDYLGLESIENALGYSYLGEFYLG